MKNRMWLLALLGCLILAALSPLASSSPDGLERVAEDGGFGQLAQSAPFQLIADYAFPGVSSEALATILAGITGTLLIFGLVFGLSRLIGTKKGDRTVNGPVFKERAGNSTIHRLDPRIKIIAALLFIVLVNCLSLAQWPALAAGFVIVVAVLAAARLSFAFVIKRSLVIIPFVLLVGIFIPFYRGGVGFVLSLGIVHITVSYAGLAMLGGIIIKAWLSILCLIALTATTPLPRLLAGLERLHVPRILTGIVSLMYRYLVIIADEARRMKQAHDSRSFGTRRLAQLRILGNIIGSLFLRSYERGERVYLAMSSRGYDGQNHCCE